MWLQTSVGKGRDVEVAQQDGAALVVALGREPVGQGVDHVELVAELGVLVRVRDVAAGRDVEVVQLDVAGQADDRVAALVDAAPVMGVAVGERHFRQNGDAVIAFLAEDEAVREAEIGHEVVGEQLGRDLDLLQAEHVGVDLGDDAPERLLAQADRVGVPGGDLEVHVWGASQLGPAAAGSDAGSAVLGAKGPVSSG